MVKVTVFDWEFRMLRDGSFQSRNEKQGLDWEVRGHKLCGMDDGRYWFVYDLLKKLASTFPEVPVPPPTSEPVVEQPVDQTQVM